MEFASGAGDALRGKASEMRDRLNESAQHGRERLEIGIHRHPMESVLIAAGAGLLLGFVLGLVTRRSSE